MECEYFDLSSEVPRVTLRLPQAGALRYLLTPSLSHLGTAYVEGDIEVKGAARDMIFICNQLARTTLKAEGKFARVLRSLTQHDKKRDAAAIRYHYDVSNEFLGGDMRYRIWHVYLAGCSYAFEQDWISLYQIVCGKAGRNPAMLPWSRNYIYAGDNAAHAAPALDVTDLTF
jgi:hypothetical protein